MKNKKFTLLIPIVLLLIIVGGIVYYVFSNRIEVDKEGGVTTKKDTVVTQEVTYEKDGTVFKFTKNRVSKTATVEMKYGISDKDEFTDFLGSKVTMAPFFINLLCGSLNRAFFDPESLNEATEGADKAKNLTEDNQFKSALEGYRVSDFKIEFMDKESNEQIATCQSSQKGFENIKFIVTRDYSAYGSFLGHKIGVIPK